MQDTDDETEPLVREGHNHMNAKLVREMRSFAFTLSLRCRPATTSFIVASPEVHPKREEQDRGNDTTGII